MKTSPRAFLATFLLASAAVIAAPFEGKISMNMISGREKPMEMTYAIKGDKVRIEMPAAKGMGGMIMDLGKKEMTMLMDEQKMYMVHAIPDAPAQAAAKNEKEEGKLEKTGEKETILGYTAEKYIWTDRNSKTEMWLAEGLGTYMSMNKGGGPMGGRRNNSTAQQWERALAGKELFPLRVVGKDSKGKESFRMETTAIKKESLADSLFAPPAGYQKFDMGGMMKGLIPGMK